MKFYKYKGGEGAKRVILFVVVCINERKVGYE